MNENKSLITTLEFAELLEQEGFLALGEPLVSHEVYKGQEHIDIYLTYKSHGIHSELVSTTFLHDASSIRKLMYGDDTLSGKPVSLSEFVDKNKERFVYAEHSEALFRTMAYVGKESKKKRLTCLLASNILNKDSHNKTVPRTSNTVSKVASIINSNINAIGRPEQVAYLSRLNSLSSGDVKEFVDLPLEWLTRSIQPPEDFRAFTLPVSKTDLLSERRVIRLN